MPKASDIVPVSEFRQDAAGIQSRLLRDKEPVVITRRGRAAAIPLSVDEHERSEHERQLRYILARGDAEVRAGKGHDLDEVLAEADELLAGG
jgi:PHD/YefM family antitoxin component YafN of YafNO toxin-antitoxin module